MQCKDIPDDLVCGLVEHLGRGRPLGATRWDLQDALEREHGPVPEALLLAKIRKMVRAGTLEGCGCGCRGDLLVIERQASEEAGREKK